jgi:uncharacterized protein
MKKAEVAKWQELTHVLGAFTFFVGPLIIYFTQENKLVREHCKMALNWQFSFLIYFVAITWVPFMDVFFKVVLIILNIVFSVMAFVKATEGKTWKYPLTIGFFD